MGAIITLLFTFLLCLSHGDLQLRIDALSAAIQQHPDSIELYQLRGELFLQHDDLNSAHQDFLFCAHHGPTNSRLLEDLSKSSAAQVDSATYYIDLSLQADPFSLSAMEWKARICFLMHQYEDSGRWYEKIISSAASPSPSLYLDASQSFSLLSEADGVDHALKIIQDGVEKLGPLHVLQKELVRLYLLQQNYELALSVQSQLIDNAFNKTTLLQERAGIFLLANNKSLALLDLKRALESLEALPSYKRSVPAMTALQQSIEKQIAELEKG